VALLRLIAALARCGLLLQIE